MIDIILHTRSDEQNAYISLFAMCAGRSYQDPFPLFDLSVPGKDVAEGATSLHAADHEAGRRSDGV